MVSVASSGSLSLGLSVTTTRSVPAVRKSIVPLEPSPPANVTLAVSPVNCRVPNWVGSAAASLIRLSQVSFGTALTDSAGITDLNSSMSPAPMPFRKANAAVISPFESRVFAGPVPVDVELELLNQKNPAAAHPQISSRTIRTTAMMSPPRFFLTGTDVTGAGV